MELLFEYQQLHTSKLIDSLNNNNICIDASDTGTGKTYCAIAISKMLNLKPFIICPKIIISTWKKVLNIFNIKDLEVSNYEKLLSNNSYNIYYKKIYNDDNIIVNYEWFFPDNSIIIFDEIHRCKNTNSQHYKLMASIKPYLNKTKCILISATIADKVKYFASIGYLLDFYNDVSRYKYWLKNKVIPNNDINCAKYLNSLIFPNYGSRIKINDLGDIFQENKIIIETYDMDNREIINEIYDDIRSCIDTLDHKESKNILNKIITARQKIELLKIPTICSLIDEALMNNLSVVVFLNFNESILKLAKIFNTESIIYENISDKKRNLIIDNFQNNITNLIILNIKSGGVGISLHDVHGDHRRMSIISPTWSGQDTIQVLGRIHRANSKSSALQKFIFCKGTIEEYIAKKLEEKLDNISLINDNILNPYYTIKNDLTESEYKNILANI